MLRVRIRPATRKTGKGAKLLRARKLYRLRQVRDFSEPKTILPNSCDNPQSNGQRLARKEPVLLHLLVERDPANPQGAGGGHAAVAVLSERALNERPLRRWAEYTSLFLLQVQKIVKCLPYFRSY